MGYLRDANKFFNRDSVQIALVCYGYICNSQSSINICLLNEKRELQQSSFIFWGCFNSTVFSNQGYCRFKGTIRGSDPRIVRIIFKSSPLIRICESNRTNKIGNPTTEYLLFGFLLYLFNVNSPLLSFFNGLLANYLTLFIDLASRNKEDLRPLKAEVKKYFC